MPRTKEVPSEIDATDLAFGDVHATHRQRSARTDESMRDGNSSHGNPGEDPEDEFSIDNDIGDSEESERSISDWLEMIPDRHGADGIDPQADPELSEP